MRRGLVWLVLAWTLGCANAQATIEYSVSVAQRDAHLFQVTMIVPAVDDELVVQMPAWNATYQIRDFASRVQDFRAFDGGDRALAVRKLDKLTWRVQTPGARHRVRVQYAVFWDETSPFAAQLNNDHAFINFAMILMYAPARRGEDATVRFTDAPPAWKAALALPAGETPNSFTAANYDALVDAPAELGAFDEARFEANGAKIRVVVHGNWEREPLLDMLRRAVVYQTTLMREVPFAEFMFIYHFGSGGGGMEHANSTAIHSNSAMPLGVSAHEFFHLWNVKRIRAQSMEPIDYSKENWTRALWFAEGVTSTYASYTLVRSGLWTQQQFLDEFAQEITRLQARPARLWKSVEEASLDAWHEKYPYYSGGAYSISYYNKGEILGVLLDILIRDATDNGKSLDDVLRDLNVTYAKKGAFYPESAGIRRSVEKMAGRGFTEFFERYVAGTDELPYSDILKRAGLLVSSSGTDRVRYEVSEDPAASPKARRIREGMLKGTNN